MNSESALERFDLTSLVPKDDRYAVLRDLIPEAFSELDIDIDGLLAALGQQGNDPTSERYGLYWPGKGAAIRAMQEPSVATLLPDPEQSSNSAASNDVVIEGDNLEVLKLLQRSYHGKVKMIFIDPPYNTGNEFIYPDNFREGLASYLRFTGQVDEEGVKASANTEASGRYHSNWLSMMYPRLVLARNLLGSDGVIFVTIDDHEVHNLRLLMDEVFGPENFVASCIWQKVFAPKNTARHFSADHDYVLVYARDAAEWRPNLLPRTPEMEEIYKNPDDDQRGPWMSDNLSARNFYSRGTYEITAPSGRLIAGPPPGTYWRISRERFAELEDDNRIWWGADGDGQPRLKRFLSEVKDGRVPQTLWPYAEVGHTQEAKKELLARVEFASSDSVFDTPKPTRLVERMLRLATETDEEAIVLDFFAGSGATGDAVWKLNQEDGGNRRFILVQLPEPTGYDDYETVADITRARLRGAIDAFGDDSHHGFKSFRLAESNLQVWNDAADADDLAEELRLFADGLVDGSGTEGIVAELLLKAGFELTEPIAEIEMDDVVVHGVADSQLLVVSEGTLTMDSIERLIGLQPALILVLDRCFGDDDELKVNALQTVRAANQGGGANVALKVV